MKSGIIIINTIISDNLFILFICEILKVWEIRNNNNVS